MNQLKDFAMKVGKALLYVGVGVAALAIVWPAGLAMALAWIGARLNAGGATVAAK